jgi:hypothetical protein
LLQTAWNLSLFHMRLHLMWTSFPANAFVKKFKNISACNAATWDRNINCSK